MKFVAILHNVRSTHNVGSVFRTADAVGAEKIYLCGITPSPLDRFGKIRADVAKVSLGAERFVSWEAARSTVAVVNRLKKEGYRIFALEQAKGSIPYYLCSEYFRADQDCKVALVVGDEVRGIPSSILKLADQVLEIPMRGKKESLNVSVAFGIAAYAVMRGWEQEEGRKEKGERIKEKRKKL